MAVTTFLSLQPKEDRSEARTLAGFGRCVVWHAVDLTPSRE